MTKHDESEEDTKGLFAEEQLWNPTLFILNLQIEQLPQIVAYSSLWIKERGEMWNWFWPNLFFVFYVRSFSFYPPLLHVNWKAWKLQHWIQQWPLTSSIFSLAWAAPSSPSPDTLPEFQTESNSAGPAAADRSLTTRVWTFIYFPPQLQTFVSPLCNQTRKGCRSPWSFATYRPGILILTTLWESPPHPFNGSH